MPLLVLCLLLHIRFSVQICNQLDVVCLHICYNLYFDKMDQEELPTKNDQEELPPKNDQEELPPKNDQEDTAKNDEKDLNENNENDKLELNENEEKEVEQLWSGRFGYKDQKELDENE